MTIIVKRKKYTRLNKQPESRILRYYHVIVTLLFSPEIYKCIMSGGIIFLCNYITFLLLFYGMEITTYVTIGVFSISIANAISLCIGSLVTLSLGRTWIFNKENQKKHVRIKFCIVVIGNYIICNILFGSIVSFLHTAQISFWNTIYIEPLVKIIVSTLQAGWTYTLYTYWVIAEKNDRGNPQVSRYKGEYV